MLRLDDFDSCEKLPALVKQIREACKLLNPLVLLSISNKVTSWENIVLENGPISRLSPGTLRACEYLQSVFVSCKNNEQIVTKDIDFNIIQQLLFNDLPELYRLSSLKSTIKFLSNTVDSNLSRIESSTLGTQQNFYNVRGRRDASFQHHYHEFLLLPHDSILQEFYGVSAQQVIEGLDAILHSTRVGAFERYVEKNRCFDTSFYAIDHLLANDELEKLFNVQLLTDWPELFVRDLSLPLWGGTDFYSYPKSGLPDDDLPIKDFPFIEINGQYYVFNYYIVADYFYRALQKCVQCRCSERGIRYEWDKKQAEATEAEVERILKSLLPQSQVFRGCYYWIDQDKKQSCECDNIVLYSDVVLVVEVKGRRRWHDAPILKGKSILTKNFSDIEKAANQTRRTEQYIKNSIGAKFYDSDWKELVELPFSGNVSIFKIVVVLDGVNELTSCKDALLGISEDLTNGVLCISIDDLLVYEKYFKSKSILFLMYLGERMKATYLSHLSTCDELDHLAAYIGDMNYADTALSIINSNPQTIVNPGSYEELNPFFAALGNPDKCIEIPYPKYPKRLDEIFSVIEKSNSPHIFQVSHFFVKLSHEKLNMIFTLLDNSIRYIRLNNNPYLVNIFQCSRRRAVMIIVKEPDIQIDDELATYFKDGKEKMLRNNVTEFYALIFGYNGMLNSVSIRKIM